MILLPPSTDGNPGMLSWLYDSILRTVVPYMVVWYTSRIYPVVAVACAFALKKAFKLAPNVHLVYDATEIEALAKNAVKLGGIGFMTNGSRGAHMWCGYLVHWTFLVYVPPKALGSANSSSGSSSTDPAWILSLRVGDVLLQKLLQLVDGGVSNADDDKDAVRQKPRRSVAALKRWGDQWRRKYAKRTMHICKVATPEQRRVIDLIKQKFVGVPFEENRAINVMLFGPPGTGKSTIPRFLAEELNGTYVDTHDPTQDNDQFENLYRTAEPTKENPLIVVLNEVEVIFQAAHKHKRDKTVAPDNADISNKTHLNSFLDMNYYENVIVVMTTNWHRRKYDRVDKSFLRSGRVHVCVEVKQHTAQSTQPSKIQKLKSLVGRLFRRSRK